MNKDLKLIKKKEELKKLNRYREKLQNRIDFERKISKQCIYNIKYIDELISKFENEVNYLKNIPKKIKLRKFISNVLSILTFLMVSGILTLTLLSTPTINVLNAILYFFISIVCSVYVKLEYYDKYINPMVNQFNIDDISILQQNISDLIHKKTLNYNNLICSNKKRKTCDDLIFKLDEAIFYLKNEINQVKDENNINEYNNLNESKKGSKNNVLTKKKNI